MPAAEREGEEPARRICEEAEEEQAGVGSREEEDGWEEKVARSGLRSLP